MMQREPVVGVDAWREGWVAAMLRDGRVVSIASASSIAELAEADAGVIGVDMPIGLPDEPPRSCDEEARSLLGRRGSSVFPAPPRDVLRAPTYAAARALSTERYGRSVSAQSYALGAKILELDAIASEDSRFHEVHPELAFMEMLGRPLEENKKTWAGHRLRIALLEREGIRIPDDVDAGAARVPVDDVVDAVVAAWSAARIAAGTARRVPRTGAGPYIWW